MAQHQPQRHHTVAIIGAGPKGLHCLERLLAEVHARPLQTPLHILVFNRSKHFGASPIYDPHQPDYILVNVSVGEIDLWKVDDPAPACGRGPDFVTWYHQRFPSHPPLDGREYLPRAIVGQYLIDGFRRITRRLPPSVTLACFQGEVADIVPLDPAYRIHFIAPDGHSLQISADKLLLSTGHARLQPSAQERSYRDFTNRHAGTIFIPYVYPVAEIMRPVPAGAGVAMKGIGLTFLDAVLELTEGRGGRFQRTSHGSLAYEASGLEPGIIYPFSRTGLPMTPKSQDLPLSDRPLTFLDEAAVKALQEKSSRQKLDFEQALLPLVLAEMELHYYRAAMDSDWREQLEACGSRMEAMRSVIEAFHSACPAFERFDLPSALDPASGRHFPNGTAYNRFIEQYMDGEISRARLGQTGSALKSALEIWYECRKALNDLLQFDCFAPASHKALLEDWFPRFKRVTFGPPLINIEKLLALQVAGIVCFSVARNPQVMLDEDSGRFNLRSEAAGGASVKVEVLVEARYPSVDLSRDDAPLYRRLHARGMVRLHRNRDAARSTYRSGAIDMEHGSQFIIDTKGKLNRDIAVIGIPTEGALVGNLTLGRDEYSARWAAQVTDQLRTSEAGSSIVRKRNVFLARASPEDP